VNTHRHKETLKPGIGLYSFEQAKNTTPFQYLAQIIVGVIFVGLGIALTLIGMRLFGIAIIVIGAFFAHAGVIFLV
jgi:hypothetical protein